MLVGPDPCHSTCETIKYYIDIYAFIETGKHRNQILIDFAHCINLLAHMLVWGTDGLVICHATLIKIHANPCSGSSLHPTAQINGHKSSWWLDLAQ